MRTIIYTTNIGSYDAVAPIASSTTLNLMFSDDIALSEGWQIVPVADPGDVDSRIRLARDRKLRPHLWLPAHEVSIWIDGNMRLHATDPDWLGFLGKSELATFCYPSTYGPRDCLYDEAAACVRRGKDDPSIIAEQVERYRDAAYPPNNGLVETSILVRLNSPRVARFNEAWWSEVTRGSRRDQISFNYVAWFSELTYSHLPGCRVDNPLASWRPHRVNVYNRL